MRGRDLPVSGLAPARSAKWVVSVRAPPHNWRNRRTPRACLLRAMNSWPFAWVINHLWLLRALIFRT